MAFQQPVLGHAIFKLFEINFQVACADGDFDPFLLFQELIVVTMQPLGVHRV